MGGTQVTPQASDNPFDVPLNSEIQESQQRQQVAQKSSPNDFNPFDEPLASEAAEQKAKQQQAGGQVTNDVGQQVIVPKDGESFHDTIQRAVALGKQRIKDGSQQAAIDAEAKTIPGKTAETLAGASAAGVLGPAALAIPGEIGEFAVRHLAKNVLPDLETFAPEAAKKSVMEMLPHALEFTKKAAELGISAGGLGYLIKSLMGEKSK